MKRVITLLEEKLHEEMVQFNRLQKFRKEMSDNGWSAGSKPEADEEMIAQLNRAIDVLKTSDRCSCPAGEWVPVTDAIY